MAKRKKDDSEDTPLRTGGSPDQAVPEDDPSVRREELHSPDEEEELGPAAALLKGAAHEVAAEVTGEPAHFAAEEALGVEHEGIEAGQVMGIALFITVALLGTLLFVFLLTTVYREWTEREVADQATYPELHERRLEANRRLTTYGVVDPQANIYHIPIDRAMDVMAEEARVQQP